LVGKRKAKGKKTRFAGCFERATALEKKLSGQHWSSASPKAIIKRRKINEQNNRN